MHAPKVGEKYFNRGCLFVVLRIEPPVTGDYRGDSILAAGLCGVCNRPRDKSPYYCVQCTITMRRRRRKDPHYYVELLPNGLYAAVLKGRNGMPDRIESVHEREQEADQAVLDYRKDWEDYNGR